VFLISGPATIQVPWGSPVTHKMQIQSTGVPMDFTIDPPEGSLAIAPLGGTTPAEISLTFDPQKYAVGDRPRFQTAVRSDDLVWGLVFNYVIVPRDPVALPDSIRFTPGAPGNLILYQAGGASRCDSAEPAPPPWPAALGGCKLRVNGQPLPLASITDGAAPPNPGFLLQPIYAIRAQLPCGIDGTVKLDFEDKSGKITSVPLTIEPVAPELMGVAGSGPQELPVRKPGESITLLLSGLGATDSPAPLGDVPTMAIRPVASLEVFVGARSTRILSAELSSADPGIVAVRAEIPNIAADVHPIVLRIGGIVNGGGSVRVLPQ
jgi:uncharacterized protein (TIGR03437 family)